ncbi:MAG: putative porin, partial [Bacteroidota bacterium]
MAVFCLFFGMGLALSAQQLPTGLGSDDEEDEEVESDSTVTDSVKKDEKVVAERTVWLDPELLVDGHQHRKLSAYSLEEVMYPDLHLRLDGFSHHLGQISKPYRRYLYGAESSFFQTGLFLNPITGNENVFMIDPEKNVRYFDTRTPYVNAYYGQGKADLAQLRVDISQNVHPLVNVSLMYYRRQSDGVYGEFATDQNNLGITSNFHTLDDRYHAFFNFLYQQHNDQLNGGVGQFFDYEELFDKGSQPLALSGADLKREQRSLYFRHIFRINKDTVDKAHRLQLYNSVRTDGFFNQYGDTVIDADVNLVEHPVLPTYDGTSDFLFEKFRTGSFKVDAGLSHRYRKPTFQLGNRVEVAQEFRTYNKNFRDYTQNSFTPSVKGDLLISPD